MKKYYLIGTEEEVFMGDKVIVPFEKEFDNGITLKRNEEFEITEDSIPYLLDMGILEEGNEDEEEDDELIDFDDEPCEALKDLTERVEKLEELGAMQTKVIDMMDTNIKNCIDSIKKAIKKAEEKEATEKKTASPKKK